MKEWRPYLISIFAAGLIFLPFFAPLVSNADTATSTSAADLQQQIDAQNQKIADLQKEIASYQSQVDLTSQQAATLKTLIQSLDLTKKKLDADVALTQTQITQTTLTISQLEDQIDTSETEVSDGKAALGSTVRQMNQAEAVSPIEVFLTDASIGSFWDDFEALSEVQNTVNQKIASLQILEQTLQTQEDALEGKKTSLVSYKQTLSGKQQAIVATTQEKSQILAQTQDQEANYKKIVAQKQADVAQFQSDLASYESALHLIVSPTSYPAPAVGILSWPLDSIRVTQYFGNTAFSATHPQVYSGMGHNGVDFGATIGTPVHAVLLGTVVGTGNTDLTCPGASYGKWVFIQHPDGLSTIYAHLSVISVKAGDTIATGQVVGYSGDTGYVTGPHLHLGLYATEGVKIMTLASKGCVGATYTMPIADYQAYLNPLAYLPAL